MNKPKFNYILNDLAFSNLQTKCLYTECTGQDIVEFENQLKLKEQELQRKDNVINELEEFIKDWQNDLEIQSESVDGLDLFEKHAQIVLDDIMTRFNELRGK